MFIQGFSKPVFVGVYALHEADRFAFQFSELVRITLLGSVDPSCKIQCANDRISLEAALSF